MSPSSFSLSIPYLTLLPHLCIVTSFLYLYFIHNSQKVSLVGVLLVSLLTFFSFPSLDRASELAVVPDSIEYAVIGKAFTSGAPIAIPILGELFPSRYPFGFGAFFVAPAQGLLRLQEHGVEILFSSLYVYLGFLAVYFIGAQIGGIGVGLLASAFLVSLPGYLVSGSELLTYAPSAALGVLFLCFLFFFALWEKPSPLALTGAAASLLLATAARPLSIFILVASTIALFFILRMKLFRVRLITSIALIGAPSITLIGSYLLYNAAFFGTPFRSGYSFWCSIPYDVPSLLLNWKYLKTSGVDCLKSGAILLLLLPFLGVTLHRSSHGSESRNLMLFFVLVASFFGIPLCIFHAVYFYPSPLFYLQATSLLTPLLASYAALVVSRAFPASHHKLTALLAASIITAQVGVFYARTNVETPRSNLVKEIVAKIPDGSLVVTGLDPVAFDYLIERLQPASSLRTLRSIPISRRVEYANKIVLKSPPEIELSSDDPFNHRSLELLTIGGREVVSVTATTDLPYVVSEVSKSRAVYLENCFTSDEERMKVTAPFKVTRITDSLVKLEAPQ